MTMMWVGIGTTAAGIATNVAGLVIGAKSQKKASKRQAAFTMFKRQEEARRLRREQDSAEGGITAGVHASNLQMSGTAQRYLNEIQGEHSYERAYAGAAARKEQRAIEAGAPGSTGTALSAAGSILSGVGSIASQYQLGTTPAATSTIRSPTKSTSIGNAQSMKT